MTYRSSFIYTIRLAAVFGSGLVLLASGSGLAEARAPVVDLSRQAGQPAATSPQTSGPPTTLEGRLAKLERILNNQTLLELSQQLQQLQQQTDQLMGQMEESQHTLEELKKRQRDLYLDLDARLQALEQAGVSSAAPTGSGGSATSGSTGEERELYQTALGGLRNQDYDKAARLFRDYLSRFPQGEYADNAQYWLGETSYVQQQYDDALAEFKKVLKNYPDSGKQSDSMLKIGLIHDAQGNSTKAQVVLTELIGKYPSTPQAQIAEKRLQRIKLRSGP